MENIRKKGRFLILFLMIGTLFVGCSNQKEQEIFTHRSPSQPKAEEEDEETESKEYIIQQMNMIDETITLYDIDSGRQVRYGYTLSTRFLDKYGDRCSSVHFTPGQVVELGELTAASMLSSVQLSDQVWTYSDVRRYEVDTTQGIFTIGQSKYRIREDTMVFSGDAQMSFDVVGADDVLQVIGKEKEILSVMVTTGHGYIQLVNSSTFVDSMICIGNRIFTTVTGDMLIEVPEGTLSYPNRNMAAYNGYDHMLGVCLHPCFDESGMSVSTPPSFFIHYNSFLTIFFEKRRIYIRCSQKNI